MHFHICSRSLPLTFVQIFTLTHMEMAHIYLSPKLTMYLCPSWHTANAIFKSKTKAQYADEKKHTQLVKMWLFTATQNECIESIRQTQQSQSISCVCHFQFGNDLFELCWFLPKVFIFIFFSPVLVHTKCKYWMMKKHSLKRIEFIVWKDTLLDSITFNFGKPKYQSILKMSTQKPVCVIQQKTYRFSFSCCCLWNETF